MRAMRHSRFAAMIATSTVVMFGLMDLNTFAPEHVQFSQTRLWMALVMGATMALVMLAFMWPMDPRRDWNIEICAASLRTAQCFYRVPRQSVTRPGPGWIRPAPMRTMPNRRPRPSA